MKKRVFIIHGWGGTPDSIWFPWLKIKLEKNDFEVIVPQMPNTDFPVAKEWITYLSKIVIESDENTYFVGHSIGCQAIMKYLQTIDQKIGGAIFVAGWFMLENLEPEEILVVTSWFESAINFEKLKRNSQNYVEIISDNDPVGGFKENKKIFSENLGAKIIVLNNAGHIEDPELPIALKELLRISRVD